MNEREYKMYIKAQRALERIKDKKIPNDNEGIKRGIKRRQEIIEGWKGMGI